MPLFEAESAAAVCWKGLVGPVDTGLQSGSTSCSNRLRIFRVGAPLPRGSGMCQRQMHAIAPGGLGHVHRRIGAAD